MKLFFNLETFFFVFLPTDPNPFTAKGFPIDE